MSLSRKLKSLRAPLFRIFLFWKEKFECPVCGYRGPFKDKWPRRHAKCPSCGELERVRFHFLVLKEILGNRPIGDMDVLHIAPEHTFREYFRKNSRSYVSADLDRTDVDRNFDIQEIPCPDASFDLVFASHVLEYPEDDRKAIREIHRVLRPGGIAVLTVPLVHHRTVDLKVRHPLSKMMHEPGLDFFERMEEVFPVVRQFQSADFPEKYQIFVHRMAITPGHDIPLEVRPGVYAEIIPVCYKALVSA